ncbi:MAG: conjugal transfer protein TraI [Terrimonas sp.]|nr:conjugal transfer protein TraI [Terrimonas sp.]OJY97912.1 MAG: conjugal transfer protein TraI [Sphingobacteriales bacterium 40-81]
MKKILAGLLLCIALSVAPTQQANAGWWIIVKEVLKKVILAIDAQVQRLQNKTIGLQNAQKALENTLSKLKFEEISDWTEKQRAQYANYFDELWKVKNLIATFQRVRETTELQVKLVKQYQRVFELLRNDRHFTPEELDHMFKVYTGMIDASLKNVEQITLVINAFKTQMSDGQRLSIISEAALGIEKISSDMQRFTNQNIRLSLQRAKDEKEISSIKAWYGLP